MGAAGSRFEGAKGRRQVIKHAADARRVPQGPMGSDPDRQGRHRQFGEKPYQIGGIAGDDGLNAADAEPGPHQRQIDQLIIAAQREILALTAQAHARHEAQHQSRAVKADHVVIGQISRRSGQSPAGNIAARGIDAKGQIGDMGGDHVGLIRAVHAQGDIRLARQQVFGGVRGDKINLDARLGPPQIGEDRGQDMGGNDARGGQAHAAAERLFAASGSQGQAGGGLVHRAGMGDQGQGGVIGDKAARLAVKQRAKRRLDFRNVARQRGLRKFETTRSLRQRAGFGDGKEGSGQGPVEIIHAKVNSMDRILGNMYLPLGVYFGISKMEAAMAKVLVLGANGNFGRRAAEAFGAAGWQVDRYARGTDMAAAAKGADLIVNALNPPMYHDWARLIPEITSQVLAAGKASGARILVPGNVYAFGRQPGPWGPNTPQVPVTRKGAIRAEMEARYASSGQRVLILRGGDFIDETSDGAVFNLVVLKAVAQGRMTALGGMEVRRAYAYLPDMARAAVGLAELGEALPRFADVPFAGLTIRMADLQAEVERQLGRRVKVGQFPWWAMTLAAPIWELAREMKEMRYLFDTNHALDGDVMARLLPGFQGLALPELVRRHLQAKGLIGADLT